MRDEPVELRIPRQEDVEQLARLFDEDMRELGEQVEFAAQRELASYVVTSLLEDRPECLCWVASRGDDLFGVLLANFNVSPKFGGRSLWLESLYVSAHGRRRGIGRRLVEQLIDWAEDHDIKGIDIEAYRGNTPAGVLYRSLGFRRLGRERFAYRVEEDARTF